MAGTEIDFHRTIEIALKTKVFDTFKIIEFTLTNDKGQTLEVSAFTNDFDLEVEDRGIEDETDE